MSGKGWGDCCVTGFLVRGLEAASTNCYGGWFFWAREELQRGQISELESEPFITWPDSQRWLFLQTVSKSTVREV